MKPHGDVRAGFRRGIYTRVLRARMGLLSKGKQQSYSAAKPAACLAEEDELEDELPQNSSGSAAPEVQKMPILSGFSAGGAEGGRTPDLLIAKKEADAAGIADATAMGVTSIPTARARLIRRRGIRAAWRKGDSTPARSQCVAALAPARSPSGRPRAFRA